MRNEKKGRLLRTAIATAGAVGLALLGVTAIAGPASATPSVGNVPGGPYTLHITKLVNPAGGPVANNGGNPQSPLPSGASPLANVDYSIAPVNGVDLSTTAGWQLAKSLTVTAGGAVTDGTNTYATGNATPLSPTAGDGTTSYTTSTSAVYLVTETGAPSSVVGLAKPFLVTLPLPNNNTWLTDVYVYPKNTVAGEPTKDIDDSNANGLGQTVNWTIAATIPSFTGDTPLSKYVVSDSLDSRLTLTSTSAVTVTLDGAAVDPSYYTVAVDSTTNVLTVTFNQDGLTYLSGKAGSSLKVGIPTTVTKVDNGTIQNTPVVYVNDKMFTGTPVQTTWGALQLKKVDQSNTANPLKGAVFQVFTSSDNAKHLTNPVVVNGATTFSSDDNGLVNIAGLKAQNDGTGANLTYYIVEVTPPNGFLVNSDFAQASGGKAVTVVPGGIDKNVQIVVADPQVGPLGLPLTGSTGTLLYVGGGIALIAIALGAALVIARRKRATVAHNGADIA